LLLHFPYHHQHDHHHYHHYFFQLEINWKRDIRQIEMDMTFLVVVVVVVFCLPVGYCCDFTKKEKNQFDFPSILIQSCVGSKKENTQIGV
jgi:hypothetical protein